MMTMTRYYAAYCALLVALLGYADGRGYVVANLFDSQSGGHHAANQYHK
jgi:hypothetical protein